MIVKAIATGARLSPFSLLWNPSFWIVVAIWTALVGFYCADLGAEQERFKQQANTIIQLEAQAKSAALVLQRERKLRADDSAEFIKFKEAQAHAQETTVQLIADLRSDNRRLRVPVRIPAAPGSDAGGNAAAGTGEEGFADLTAGAAEFLVNLTARGDDGIRKHAEVVDRYERLRIACTAPVDTSIPPTGETP
jgi:hypothetical protein